MGVIAFATPKPYVPPPGIDEYTKLMLHMDGSDDGTVFTDDSFSEHTITRVNAVTKTAIKKFGTASGYFDGSGDYLSIPDSGDWNFGTGDFTIDCWLYLNASDPVPIYSQLGNTGSDNNRILYGFWAGNWNFYAYTTSTQIFVTVADSNPATGEWMHIALVRDGIYFNFYKNGILIGTPQGDSSAVPSNPGAVYVGATRISSTFPIAINGYIDELRVSKGIARWTIDFDPPTSPYTT